MSNSLRRGACVNLPEDQKRWFFDTEKWGKARAICKTCSVRAECEADAESWELFEEEIFGVRGAMTVHARELKYRKIRTET